MRLRYLRPSEYVARVVGEYEWSQRQGWVQDVDAPLAAILLTDPKDEWAVDAEDPLVALKGIGPQRAAGLALAGVGTLEDMAALDADGIAQVADMVWASAEQVGDWVMAAREQLR